MPDKGPMRVSPCYHGGEVSIVKSHSMDQYCANKLCTKKRVDRLSENKSYPGMSFFPWQQSYLAMAYSIDGYCHKGHVK